MDLNVIRPKSQFAKAKINQEKLKISANKKNNQVFYTKINDRNNDNMSSQKSYDQMLPNFRALTLQAWERRCFDDFWEKGDLLTH